MSLSEQHAASLSAETVVVAAGRPPREHDAPVNPPIVLSSTYFGTGALDDGDRGYGRYANPTWDPFEEAWASSKAPRCLAFSTHPDWRRSVPRFHSFPPAAS